MIKEYKELEIARMQKVLDEFNQLLTECEAIETSITSLSEKVASVFESKDKNDREDTIQKCQSELETIISNIASLLEKCNLSPHDNNLTTKSVSKVKLTSKSEWQNENIIFDVRLIVENLKSTLSATKDKMNQAIVDLEQIGIETGEISGPDGILSDMVLNHRENKTPIIITSVEAAELKKFAAEASIKYSKNSLSPFRCADPSKDFTKRPTRWIVFGS